MSPMQILRLVGLSIGVIIIAATIWLAVDRFDQKEAADAARACNVAAEASEKPLSDCLPNVRAQIEQARQARVCEQALTPSLRPETRFAMQQACGAGTKREVARADAAESSLASAHSQIADLRAATIAAVGRAEARATKQQERDQDARQAIADAPRSAAGGIHCDAECLRRLSR